MRVFLVVLALAMPATARADLENNEAIHDHIDALLASSDVTTLDATHKQALLADHLTLTLGALVPIFGTYELDRTVFGDVRPTAFVFDWFLGGIAPATLAVAALSQSGRLRSVFAWTALGLYAATRLGVLVIGNLHVSEYNRVIGLRLGLVSDTSFAPALVASTTW